MSTHQRKIGGVVVVVEGRYGDGQWYYETYKPGVDCYTREDWTPYPTAHAAMVAGVHAVQREALAAREAAEATIEESRVALVALAHGGEL